MTNKNKGKIKLITVVGPTASGKSDLAVLISKKFNGEVISADSRQVYKGMDIGSGKITKKEMQGIKHYLLDVASPKKTFTVSQYKKLSEDAIEKIISKPARNAGGNKLPIICGGTGFYIDTLINDLEIPNIGPQLKLRKELEKKSTEELFLQLKKLDPARAKNIDKFNRRRLVRALEIIITTGKPVKKISANKKYDVLKIGILRDFEDLKKLIKIRLEKRIKKGMIGEVKKLHASGVSWKRLEDFGLEYRFVAQYLQNKISKDEMVEKILMDSIHYAKRQMTWFKRDKEIFWITLNDENGIEKVFDLCEKFINEK